jgi:PIN domain nuclease of toxin-antitoxin system
MNALLDTCAIIWLANQDERLSAVARQAIDRAWMVHVSPVSAWELGLKIAKGRLALAEPLETWWPRVIETHDLSEFPLYGAEAARSTRLPPIHTDPADRLLIAIAMEHQFTLLTPDPKIAQYPNLQILW